MKTCLSLFLLTGLILLLPLNGCAQKQKPVQTTLSAQRAKLPSGVEVVDLPTVTLNDKLLEAIAAPYKGKVVVIDFWATWCRPCMMAMQRIDPIKEKYLKAKKDVAFVYVTGETSPKADWDRAIQNIKGYHYRLTEDQYNALMNKLGIMSIPTYIILNK